MIRIFVSFFLSCFLQFLPKSAPPNGETELTLFGSELMSPLQSADSVRTYRVKVGEADCKVLHEKSNSTQ